MTAARAIKLPRLPKSLTVNALALMAATIGANGLGLVFWAVAAHLRPLGVTISVSDTFRGRACTHLDVSAAQIDEAVTIMRKVVT